jgi:hypothetical protein
VLYVLNAEQLGTNDDRAHLRKVFNVTGGKNVLFAVNKLDKFRSSDDDDVAASLAGVRAELADIGFTAPVICPVSGRAALLAKLNARGIPLNKDDKDDLAFLQDKFANKQYDFSRFYPKAKDQNRRFGEYDTIVTKSGLAGLEQLLYKLRK